MALGAILAGAGAIGSAIAGLGSGIYNAIHGYNVDNKNYELQKEQQAFQKEQFEYQKEMDALTREREDTAIQRRAADLESAGLSKTLAAGSGAGASGVSAPVKVEAPQRGFTSPLKLQGLEQLSALSSQLLDQKKEKALINQVNQQTDNLETQNKIIKYQAGAQRLNTLLDIYGKAKGFATFENQVQGGAAFGIGPVKFGIKDNYTVKRTDMDKVFGDGFQDMIQAEFRNTYLDLMNNQF